MLFRSCSSRQIVKVSLHLESILYLVYVHEYILNLLFLYISLYLQNKISPNKGILLKYAFKAKVLNNPVYS